MRRFISLGILFFSLLFLSGSAFAFESLGGYDLNFDIRTQDTMYFTRDNEFFSSSTKGLSWLESNITLKTFKTQNFLAIDPRDPETLYLLRVNEQGAMAFFKSANNGVTFGQVDLEGLPTLSYQYQYYFKIIADNNIDKPYYIYIYQFSPETHQTTTKVYRSPDRGVHWELMELKGLSVASSSDSVLVYPYVGLTASRYLFPWFAIVSHPNGNNTWTTSLYHSTDKGQSFFPILNIHFPADNKMYYVAVDPTQINHMVALAVDPQNNQHVYQSFDEGMAWTELVFPAGSSPVDRVQFHPANRVTYYYTREMVYQTSRLRSELTEYKPTDVIKVWNQPGKNYGESVQYYFDRYRPLRVVAYFPNDNKLLISQDEGATWASEYPFYQATWKSQLPFGVASGVRDGFVDARVSFQNTGNVIWQNMGNKKLGLYVYKDERYSTPQNYSDPNSVFFGQSYFADVLTWGPSANSMVPNARAALLSERYVEPMSEGTFAFHFYIPLGASSNSLYDDPSTLYNDSFYREDLSLAFGENWMPNPKNGDPLGIAHIWFPIRVY
ncbi:MAG: hypothetical protein WCP97_01815 [bacterium]